MTRQLFGYTRDALQAKRKPLTNAAWLFGKPRALLEKSAWRLDLNLLRRVVPGTSPVLGGPSDFSAEPPLCLM